MTERFPTDNEMQCAWDDYVEAADNAKQTQKIDDAIVAGKMWGRFIRMFERGGIKQPTGSNVIYVERFGGRTSKGRGSDERLVQDESRRLERGNQWIDA